MIGRVHRSAAKSVAALAADHQDLLDDDLRVRRAVLAESERFNGQCGANGPHNADSVPILSVAAPQLAVLRLPGSARRRRSRCPVTSGA